MCRPDITSIPSVLRTNRDINAAKSDALLVATAERPIVEVSTADRKWDLRPLADRYNGQRVPEPFRTDFRRQLGDRDRRH